MAVAVYQHPNGISLNGREWLLDDNGNLMEFDTYEQAKEFLLDNGFEETHIGECVFIEDCTTCSKCGHRFSSENSYEPLQNRYVCPKCEALN